MVKHILLVLLVSALASLSGCLSLYAPSLNATEHHADVAPQASADDCMSCHIAESRFEHASAHAAHSKPIARPPIARPPIAGNLDAPLVRDWMLQEERGCLQCHALSSP